MDRAQLSLAPHTIIPEQSRELGPQEPQKAAAGDAFDEEFTSHYIEQLPTNREKKEVRNSKAGGRGGHCRAPPAQQQFHNALKNLE